MHTVRVALPSSSPWLRRDQRIVTAGRDKVKAVDDPVGVDVTAAGLTAYAERFAKGAADAGEIVKFNGAVVVGVAAPELGVDIAIDLAGFQPENRLIAQLNENRIKYETFAVQRFGDCPTTIDLAT